MSGKRKYKKKKNGDFYLISKTLKFTKKKLNEAELNIEISKYLRQKYFFNRKRVKSIPQKILCEFV